MANFKMLHSEPSKEPVLVNLDLVTTVRAHVSDQSCSEIEFVNEKTILVREHPDFVVAEVSVEEV